MTVKVIGAVWSKGPPPFLLLASWDGSPQGRDTFGAVRLHESPAEPPGEGRPNRGRTILLEIKITVGSINQLRC